MVKKLKAVSMRKNYKRLIRKSLELKKMIKKKGDKLFLKWKGYDNSFNSWINEKDII